MTSLGSIPALRRLPPAALPALTAGTRPVRLGPGAVLRPAGERARAVVLLLSGAVAATYHTAGGAEVWTGWWEGPSMVDKPAVLDGGAAPTGLVAVTGVSARLLPRERFLRLLDEQRPVREHVLGHLARDALAGQYRLGQATALPAVVQVAAWLQAQGGDPGREPGGDRGREPGGDRGVARRGDRGVARRGDRGVAWRGSQEQLARVLGLSRITVNRALARLSGAGAVRRAACGIVVVDAERLAAWAAGVPDPAGDRAPDVPAGWDQGP